VSALPEVLLLVIAGPSVQIEGSEADLQVGSGHTVNVTIELGADGRSVFSGRSDGLVAHWNLSTGARVATYASKEHPFRCFAPSPTCAEVALGFDHGVVQIWRADDEDATRCFRAHDSPVSRIMWSPDDRYLVTLGEEREMCVWDVASGRRITRQVSVNTIGDRACAAFAPDGSRLAFASKSVVKWLELAKPELTHELPGNYGGVTNIAFSADGKQLVATTERGEDDAGWCHAWSIDEGCRLAKFGRAWPIDDSERDPVALARFSADGERLVTLDIFGQLEARETDCFELLWSTALGSGGWPSPRISGDLDVRVDLAVWSGGGSQANVFRIGERRSLGTVRCDPQSVIAIHPSGRWILTQRGHIVRVFDVATCSPCWARVEFQEGEWLCIASDWRYFGTPKAEGWARVRTREQRTAAPLDPALRDLEAVRHAMTR